MFWCLYRDIVTLISHIRLETIYTKHALKYKYLSLHINREKYKKNSRRYRSIICICCCYDVYIETWSLLLIILEQRRFILSYYYSENVQLYKLYLYREKYMKKCIWWIYDIQYTSIYWYLLLLVLLLWCVHIYFLSGSTQTHLPLLMHEQYIQPWLLHTENNVFMYISGYKINILYLI